MRLANSQALWLLLVLPVLVLLYRRGDAGRRRAEAAWGNRAAGAAGKSTRLMLLLAILSLTLALARPVTVGPAARATAPKTGDLVFLLDVSRSMLANDVAPNRLGRAKAIIAELLTQLKGDRVALIAFAGNTAVACPLTVDYAFFQDMLEATGPDTVTRGGSQLGDAIRFAAEQGFDDLDRESKHLVLLSDGEDHDGEDRDGEDYDHAPAGAAREASRRGIHILAIGVGDENTGGVVPQSETDRTPFLYHGRPVETRLDARTLRSVGSYLDGARIDAAAVYSQYLAPKGRPVAARPDDQSAWWPYLLAVALALLVLETRLAERKATVAVVAIAAMALLLRPPALLAQTVEEWMEKGRRALWSHQHRDAVHYFSQAAQWAPAASEVRFNLALALYDDGQFREAATVFEQAAHTTSQARLKAKSKFGQANATYRYALQMGTLGPPGLLRAAVMLWRETLALDPTLTDAQFNIDLMEDLMRRPPPPAPSGEPVDRPGADPRRAQETDPNQIVRESKVPAPAQGKGRKAVDKDW